VSPLGVVPGSTGRPSIPETVGLDRDASGMLDAPAEPVIGRRFAPIRWRGMTANWLFDMCI